MFLQLNKNELFDQYPLEHWVGKAVFENSVAIRILKFHFSCMHIMYTIL